MSGGYDTAEAEAHTYKRAISRDSFELRGAFMSEWMTRSQQKVVARVCSARKT